MNALVYLVGCSVVNGVKTRVKRLAKPKYLLGTLFGLAYFYLYFWKVLPSGGGRSAIPDGAWETFAAVLLLVAALVFSWLLPTSRAAVTFTEAEIAFLFPAPLRRRSLIIFKLARSQFALLLLVLLFTIIAGRFREGPSAWFRMGGWWVILNTLTMHRIGASFALSRLHSRGMADWKRRLAFAVLVAGAGWLVWRLWMQFPAPALHGGALAGEIERFLREGPLRHVLVPFRLVVAPYFAGTLGEFGMAMLPALGVMAAHFWWVIRADASFEDAAIETAKRRAAAIAAVQKGDSLVSRKSARARVPLFRLGPLGFVPVAFFWKSLLRIGGRRTLVKWGIAFAVLAAAVAWLHVEAQRDPPPVVVAVAVFTGGACYIAVLVSLVMVGQTASGQLRQGMSAMDLLKTYPVPGWQFALGELIGPVALGTVIQYLALGTGAAVMLAFPQLREPRLQTVLLATGGAFAVFLPLFNLATSILPSAVMLAFPGWMKPGEAGNASQRGGGFEVMGLRMLIGISQLLLVACALVPVAYFAGCGFFAARMHGFGEGAQFAVAAASGATMMALEAALGIAWVGWLFDRFDVSGE